MAASCISWLLPLLPLWLYPSLQKEHDLQHRRLQHIHIGGPRYCIDSAPRGTAPPPPRPVQSGSCMHGDACCCTHDHADAPPTPPTFTLLLRRLQALARGRNSVLLANTFVDAPYHRTGLTLLSASPDEVRLRRATAAAHALFAPTELIAAQHVLAWQDTGCFGPHNTVASFSS
jgi:hypothetical protein